MHLCLADIKQKNTSQTFKQLVYEFENISSEILSESVEVFFSKVLK